MKTWLSGTRDRLVRIPWAAFSMVALIGVGGGVSAQPVLVTITQTSTSSPNCSDPQPGPGGLQYIVCVSTDPVQTTGSGSVSITWTTGSGGWAFPASQGGIVIDSKQNKSKSNGNQPWTVTQASTSNYTATNTKENGQKKYAYTVNVVNITNGVVYLLTYDPTIMN